MFEFFAKKLGRRRVARSRWSTPRTPGLVSYALADRADAVQIWEPAYTLLLSKKPTSARSTSASRRPGRPSPAAAAFPISASARMPTGPTQNPALVRQALRDLQGGGRMDTEESRRSGAAGRAGRDGRRREGDGVADPLATSGSAMSLVGADEVRKEIEAVYKAGIDVGYFPAMPSADSVYAKPMSDDRQIRTRRRASCRRPPARLVHRGGLAGRVVVLPALPVSAGARHRRAHGGHPHHRAAARRGAGHRGAHLRRPRRRLPARLPHGAC